MKKINVINHLLLFDGYNKMCKSLKIKPVEFSSFNTTTYHKTRTLYKNQGKPIKQYYKYVARIAPKKGYIAIYKVFYSSANLNNSIKFDYEILIDIEDIPIDIPFTTINDHKRYSQFVCETM